jgi:DNA-binding beta-propeller fold protein YncE
VTITGIDGGGDNLSQYNVGVGGLLAPLTPTTVAAGDLPQGVAVSPDGKSVYVANSSGNSVSQYDVGPR